MEIFARVLWRGAINHSGAVENRNFSFMTSHSTGLAAVYTECFAEMFLLSNDVGLRRQKNLSENKTHFTAWCYRSVIMPQCSKSSVRPPVCLSVTSRYRDNVGWNTSKIISRPNSLRYLPKLSIGDLMQREHPQRQGGIRVGSHAQKPRIYLKRCKAGPRLPWQTIITKSHLYALSIGAKINEFRLDNHTWAVFNFLIWI